MSPDKRDTLCVNVSPPGPINTGLCPCHTRGDPLEPPSTDPSPRKRSLGTQELSRTLLPELGPPTATVSYSSSLEGGSAPFSRRGIQDM